MATLIVRRSKAYIVYVVNRYILGIRVLYMRFVDKFNKRIRSWNHLKVDLNSMDEIKYTLSV